MNNKNKKTNKKLIYFIIVIFIAIFLSIVIHVIYKKITDKPDSQSQYKTTEEMKEQAPLIDMNNTENVKFIDGEKVNYSEKLNKSKDVSELNFSNIKLKTKSGISIFTAIVKNNSKKDYKGGVATLIFKNNNGTILSKVETFIPEIKTGRTTIIKSSTTVDIINANDFEVILK